MTDRDVEAAESLMVAVMAANPTNGEAIRRAQDHYMDTLHKRAQAQTQERQSLLYQGVVDER